MGADEVNAFLSSLAVDQNVSVSTQNQALSALLFLYRDVLGDPLPWIADIVRGVSHLVALLLYESGLRLLECLRLRVKDVDFARLQISVRDPKGGRDRMTMLARAALELVREQLVAARVVHEGDLREGLGVGLAPGCNREEVPERSEELAMAMGIPSDIALAE